VGKAIPILLLSAFKFLPCPSLAVVLGFNFWQTMLITVPGGILGVVFFFLSANFLMDRSKARKAKKLQEGNLEPIRKFTWLNKSLVKVKKRFGMVGIAILTPAFLSIPLGSIVMAKFFKHNKMALPVLMVSVVFWGVVLTVLSIKFNFRFQ
jgi:uncharacterized membrane protein